MLKKIVAIGCLLLSGMVHAFVPQSGTWIVNGEANGEPGRGFSVDVQGDTMVLQVYGYESSGQPTFYLASGPLTDNRFNARLARYAGGKALGGASRSAVESGSPGDVSVRFTSGISGFITLPGEREVAIRRFEFGVTRKPSALTGTWLYVAADSDADAGELVNLTKKMGATGGGTGVVTDPVRQLGCEFRAADDGPYNLYCGVVAGTSVKWIAKIKLVGQEGEGITLDPVTGKADGVVYIRKLRDGKGRYLGLFQ